MNKVYYDIERKLNADSEETTAMFAYTFQFADDEVVYRYTRISGTELRDEKLIINGKKQIFTI